MKHTRTLPLAVCLAVVGCTGSKEKTTWQKVREVRPDKTSVTADASSAYANKLHKVLLANKVEHRVVTYQFRYKTRLREDAVGTRSAVIYKDNSDPRNPWWLVSEKTSNPVWLPGTDLNKQVAFYLQRNADVVAQNVFNSGEPQPTGTLIAAQYPAKPAPALAPVQIARSSPRPAVQTGVAQAAPKVEPMAFIRPARFGPSSPGVVIPYTTPAPTELRFDEVFRRAHGTDFDPASEIDRRKMESIRHALIETRERTTTRTF